MFQFLQDEHGTAAIEYSLFVSLIGLIVVGAFHVLGANLVDAFSSISAGLTPLDVIENIRKTGLSEEF